MYCSHCGHALAQGQPVCQQCGQPVAAVPVPPVPGFQFELTSYASKLRALSVVWYIWGGLSLVFGFLGLAFADAFMHGRFNHWMRGPIPPMWFGPAFVHFIWVIVLVRSALSLAAGYGLMHREPWGRVVALVAAFVNILKFPFGTALGIWTLVTLLGFRNTTLYQHIAEV